MSARCPRQHCGVLLLITTNGHGGVVATCPACERNRQGLCRDCPRPLASAKAMRCPSCRRKRRALVLAAAYQRSSDERLAQQRRRLQDPEKRAARQAYMRRYNAEYRADPIGREVTRLANKAWRATPKGRAATRAANARAQRKNAAQLNRRRRERRQAARLQVAA